MARQRTHRPSLRSSRFDNVWIITTRKRAAELEELDALGYWSIVPARVSAAKLASLLEGAISRRGTVAANKRLGQTMVIDRWGLLTQYKDMARTVEGDDVSSSFWSRGLDGPEVGLLGMPTTRGRPVRWHGYDMSLQDFFRLLADMSGMNVVVQPGIDGKTTVWLQDVPWGYVLDAVLLVQGLRWTLQENLITIARPKENEEPVVETLRLSHEDPRFFLAFAKALTPAGTLRVDEASRSLVVRDIPERVKLLNDMVKDLDRPAPR